MPSELETPSSPLKAKSSRRVLRKSISNVFTSKGALDESINNPALMGMVMALRAQNWRSGGVSNTDIEPDTTVVDEASMLQRHFQEQCKRASQTFTTRIALLRAKEVSLCDVVIDVCKRPQALWTRTKLICSFAFHYFDLATDIVVAASIWGTPQTPHYEWASAGSIIFIFAAPFFLSLFTLVTPGYRHEMRMDALWATLVNLLHLRPMVEFLRGFRETFQTFDLHDKIVEYISEEGIELETLEKALDGTLLEHMHEQSVWTDDCKSEILLIYKAFRACLVFPTVLFQINILVTIWDLWGTEFTDGGSYFWCSTNILFFISIIVGMVTFSVEVEDLIERRVPPLVFADEFASAVRKEKCEGLTASLILMGSVCSSLLLRVFTMVFLFTFVDGYVVMLVCFLMICVRFLLVAIFLTDWKHCTNAEKQGLGEQHVPCILLGLYQIVEVSPWVFLTTWTELPLSLAFLRDEKRTTGLSKVHLYHIVLRIVSMFESGLFFGLAFATLLQYEVDTCVPVSQAVQEQMQLLSCNKKYVVNNTINLVCSTWMTPSAFVVSSKLFDWLTHRTTTLIVAFTILYAINTGSLVGSVIYFRKQNFTRSVLVRQNSSRMLREKQITERKRRKSTLRGSSHSVSSRPKTVRALSQSTSSESANLRDVELTRAL